MRHSVNCFSLIIIYLFLSVTSVHAHDAKKEKRVRQISPLQFGTFTVGRGDGNIIVDARNGGCTASGSIVMIGAQCDHAEFEIIGKPGRRVMISLPHDSVLENESQRGRMRMKKMTVWPEDFLTLDANGKARVAVGATLKANSNERSGSYSGLFSVDVRYVD